MSDFWTLVAALEASLDAAAKKDETLSALSSNFGEDHRAIEDILTPIQKGLETLPSFFDRKVVNLGKDRPRVTYTMNEFWAQAAADKAKKAAADEANKTAAAEAEKAKTLSALSTNFVEDHRAVEHPHSYPAWCWRSYHGGRCCQGGRTLHPWSCGGDHQSFGLTPRAYPELLHHEH
jgi:hypothetical protein